MANLPKITEGKTLKIPYFPTDYQALIFRLWEMVPAEKLAEVIETSVENVEKTASDLGLGEQKELDEWMTRGYISIIRAVWNLLPYSQILQILEWSEERFAYILKEDDFLDIKLGEKCDCKKVVYRELTSSQAEETKKIKAVMQKYIRSLDDKDIAKRFDFFKSNYAPLVTKKVYDVNVDSSWCIDCKVENSDVNLFIDDFKKYVKKNFGVTFSDSSNKKIEIRLDINSTDEEYHEIEISDNLISINAAFPVGILRALYDIEDLAESAGNLSFKKKTYKKKTKIKTRFIYSFCGLYGDVLDKDSKISFPDELLEGYARNGINGVWIQGVLYTLAPYPFDEQKCVGWETRLKNLNELTLRAARYGIKVYIYINEPRNMPLSFFEKYPDMKGSTFREGTACLCSSHPKTHQYLKDALQMIAKKAPKIGGFMAITQSENLVTCYARGKWEEGDVNACPVCSKKKASEVTAKIVNTMADAVAEVDKNIKFFAYSWVWDDMFEDELDELLGMLSKNVIILHVSETKMKVNRSGVESNLIDYSLSIVGPSEASKEIWSCARKYNLEVGAKVQINNSWECSTAPFLPVYNNVLEHINNLREENIEHIMLSWTLGGYNSDNIKIASSCFFEDENETEDVYDTLLQNTYGEYADKVKTAVNYMCEGFSEYPFHVGHIYSGPSNAGAANILYDEPSNMTATMTCYPYDDLERWCSIYTPEILEKHYAMVCEKWEKGLEILEGMPVCEFYDMALYGYTLFKGSLNQIRYYIERDSAHNDEKMKELVKSEKELALLAYSIMLRNSAVGYEAANHYYVTKSSFCEKVVCCEYLLNK